MIDMALIYRYSRARKHKLAVIATVVYFKTNSIPQLGR